MAHLYDPFRPDPRLHMPPIPHLGRDAATGPVTMLAYVDRYVPMVNAGAEWMLHAMLADSAARGHRVVVATPCTDRPRVVDGVEVYPVREGLRAGEDAELVVGHLLFTREAIDHARSTRRPLLYLVHNSDQIKAWRITRDDVSAFVWNSEWIARAGRYLPDVRTVPGTVVRPPLDMARYVTPDWSPRTHVTLVNPILAKGSPVFYALAARFPRYRFLAVEGAYGSQQRPQVQHRNVDWQPATPTIAEDVYARTRVLLMPSTYESWGRVACEALCSGIPVIAAPTPGLREALAGAATFVDPEDIDGWADALRALDDPSRYAEAAGAALDRAAELGDLARVDLDRWDRLVRLAAGGTRVRSGSMETTPADRYDPFRGHKAHPTSEDELAAREAADRAAVPDHAGVLAAWLEEVGGAVRTVEIQRVWLPEAEAAPEAAWEGLYGVHAGTDDSEPDLAHDEILAVLTDPAVEIDASAADAAEDTDRTFRGYLVAANGQTLVLVSSTLPIISAEDDEEPTTEAHVAAQEPETDTPPDGATEPVGAQEDAQEPGEEPDPWEVPTKAVDIVHALGSEQDPAEAQRKAQMVLDAERQRSEPRVSVVGAAEKILG